MKKYLVIGGAGYLGSVLVGRLLKKGHAVRVLDRGLHGWHGLEPYASAGAQLEKVAGDMRHMEDLAPALQGVDGVAVLAAIVGEPACKKEPQLSVETNYLAPIAAAQACRYYKVPRFLFASTDSAYGIQEGILTETNPLNPISLYAELKAQVEKELLALKTKDFAPCILRMATLYGLSPRMRFDLILNILTRDAVLKKAISIHGGLQWRPLVHSQDAALAYVLAFEAPVQAVSGEIFNVGSNKQNYRIGDLGEAVCKALPGTKVNVVPQNPDLRDYHVNFDKIGKAVGYKVAHSIEDGIKEMAEAVRAGKFGDCSDRKYYNA